MNLRDDVKAFVDGELDATRAEALRDALRLDPELAREVEDMRAIGEAIQRHVWRPEPVGLEAALTRVARRRLPRGLAWAGGALGLLLALVLIGPLLSPARHAAVGDDALVAGSAPARDALDVPPPPAAGVEALATRVPGRPAPEVGPVAQAAGATEVPPPVVPDDPTRLVIRNGTLTVKVTDVEIARREAIRVVRALGGYAESDVAQGGAVSPTAVLTFRVPAGRFERAILDLERLGDMLERSTSGEDVTTQVADVEARLRVMRQEENSLLEVLKVTRRVGEILSVRDRLATVRSEIEGLQAQAQSFRRMAAMSTLSLTLVQRERVGVPEPGQDWASETWAAARNALAAVGRLLAQAGIFVLVLAPIWLPIALVVWWLSRRARR